MIKYDQYYVSCALCGKRCGVDRRVGQYGFCGSPAGLRAACAVIHKGEEPPVVGAGGSGTIFFSGCTLRCPFCQNHQVSRGGIGKDIGPEEFVDICLSLQQNGAVNINLVTGTQFIPSIAEGLIAAKARGLTIPVLWNSSGYEQVRSLSIVHPHLDVYLPDVKTLDSELSRNLFGAEDYPEATREAVLFMAKERPLKFEGDVMKSGVIVRHLVFPGLIESTKQVLEWFKAHLYGVALLSVMMQYTPIQSGYGASCFFSATHRVSEGEYEEVLDYLDELGIEEGFIQDPSEADEAENAWLPDFTKRNPFPSKLSKVVWHYQHGFCSDEERTDPMA